METLDSGQQQQLERYLQGRETDSKGKLKIAWFGRSGYHAKDRVKAICRGDPSGPNYTAYDPENRWWGTKSLAIVPILIDSGLWTPVGISENLISSLHLEATRRSAGEETVVKQENPGDLVAEETLDTPSPPPPPKRRKKDVPDSSYVEHFVHTFHRQCPMCDTTPIEQFFECSCCDKDCAQWEKCEKCRSIHNPSKLRRLDAGELDENIDTNQKLVIRAGFACMC
jgi:hypothetical protein